MARTKALHDRGDWPGLAVSAKALRTCEPPISGLMARALGNPQLISFAAGLVDERALPFEECRMAAGRLFANEGWARGALQYGTTLGLKPLRQRLVKHLEWLEGKPAAAMGFSADQMLLTTGSQQSLYLVADALLDPGDIVIAASPSYFVFTGALASLGARVIGVPMDDEGMIVEQIPPILNRLKREGELSRVKFVYCTSFFQNPTGLTLSLERRKRLLEIVKQYSGEHRMLVVEDAAYRELRYGGPALPSIKSFDGDNQYTVLTQTFSKPYAPGLKLGYTVMPQDLLEHVLRQKGNHDFGSANLCQWLAAEAMRGSMYSNHVGHLCRIYRSKRDLMMRELTKHLRMDQVRWTKPEGGLYLWLTLPEKIVTSPGGGLFEACLELGVLYVPGAYAYGSDGKTPVPENHLRLCFGQVRRELISEGIRRFAMAVSQVSDGKGGR